MKVRYTQRALRDLDGVYRYIDEHFQDVALFIKALIEFRIASLAEFPLIAPETEEVGIYQLSIPRYSYKIYYEIDDDEVWILHILHTSRDEW